MFAIFDRKFLVEVNTDTEILSLFFDYFDVAMRYNNDVHVWSETCEINDVYQWNEDIKLKRIK
jgi:hypothetical protein